jgi:hypothetical protein
MYRYCSVSPRECKCIHLYSDTLVRYIGIQHTYTSMKPNETAIHQMYRTSIQLYICTHVETEPNIGIQRYSAIQRYSDTTRYSDTHVSPPLSVYPLRSNQPVFPWGSPWRFACPVCVGRSNFWYTYLAGPWSYLGRTFRVALSQAMRVRLSLQTARSWTRESVRCTRSPRPTQCWRLSDGSVLESVRYENAPSL